MPEPVVWPAVNWVTMVTTEGPTFATAWMIAPDSDWTETFIASVAAATGAFRAPVSSSATNVAPPPTTAPTSEVARRARTRRRLGAARSAAGASRGAGSNQRSGVEPSGWKPARQGGRCSGTGS